MSATQFSPFQSAVFTWVETQAAARPARPAALIVEAVAGSGKTTTIVEAAKRIPATDRAVFLAFNKSIATELQQRLPNNIEAKTLNALGWSLLRSHLRLNPGCIDAKKTQILLDRMLVTDRQRYAARTVAAVVAKCKSVGLVPPCVPAKVRENNGLQLATGRALADVVAHFDIEIPEDFDFDEIAEWTLQALEMGIENTKLVDLSLIHI